MSQLIFIRHAESKRDDSVPANQWRLSQAGREACRPLADALTPYGLTKLVSSMEPKAIETARLTAGHLGIPSEIAAGLHEHDRSNVGYLGAGRFQDLVKDVLVKTDERVFGLETGAQARQRFTQAVEELVAANPDETLGLVSHGTVMSLFVVAANDLAPYDFWRRLGMPSFVVLSLPRYELVEVVESV